MAAARAGRFKASRRYGMQVCQSRQRDGVSSDVQRSREKQGCTGKTRRGAVRQRKLSINTKEHWSA